MQSVEATVKPYSRVKTKKEFKEMVAAINAGVSEAEVDVTVFIGFESGTAGVSDLLTYDGFRDTQMIVTNQARTWFSTVRVVGGKLKAT